MIKSKVMSYAGKAHLAAGKRCQDYSFSCNIKGVTAVALADGAGSASHAADGAMIAAKTTCIHVCENFDRIYENENADKEKFFVIEAVRYAIENKYQTEDFADFNSTLLCAAVKGDRCIILHLGDGVVGRISDSEEIFSVVSAPMNGLTRQQTYLTGMKNAYMHLRLYRTDTKNLRSLILLTDGLAGDIFDFPAGVQRENVSADTVISGDCDSYFKELYSGDDDFSYAVITVKGG